MTGCPATWTVAADPQSWSCSGVLDEDTVLLTCGTYNYVARELIDSGFAYYYDATSGRLLAVTASWAINGGSHCTYGVVPTEPCNDPNPVDPCANKMPPP